jgi:hypothetical protein
MPAAAEATPPNPRPAAINATIRKIKAHPNRPMIPPFHKRTGVPSVAASVFYSDARSMTWPVFSMFLPAPWIVLHPTMKQQAVNTVSTLIKNHFTVLIALPHQMRSSQFIDRLTYRCTLKIIYDAIDRLTIGFYLNRGALNAEG